MLTVTLLLLLAAGALAIFSAMSPPRWPLPVAVILVIVVLLLQVLPKG